MILDLVVGLDPLDASSLPAPDYRYLERAQEQLSGSLRVAYSRDFGGVPVQVDVADVVEGAVGWFRRAGHRVTVIDGGPPDLGMYWSLLLGRELDAWIGVQLADRGREVTRSLVKTIEASRAATPGYWGAQAQARMDLVRWFARVFGEYDLLLTPTVPCDPPPAKGPLPSHIGESPLPISGVAAFTLPISFAGLPAASVRAGASQAKLPVGLQIVGPRCADDLVLAVSHAFEREQSEMTWPRLA